MRMGFASSIVAGLICLGFANAVWAKPPSCGGEPVAEIAFAQNQLDIPIELTLDGSGSSDCDGEIIAWRWSFGDQSAEGAVVETTFDTAGAHEIILEVEDNQGNLATAGYTLDALEDFCPILPITIDQVILSGATSGQFFDEVPSATGPGNYSQLSWNGSNSANVFAASLLLPGDSYNYVAPDDDRILNIGDWVQGHPGKNNSSSVRAALDALIGQDIIIPSWSEHQGSGSNLDYLVADFVTIELTDYALNGSTPSFSFIYKGQASCYNDPPDAMNQSLETLEDAPLTFELDVVDPEDDALTVEVVQEPENGVLSIVDGTELRFVPDTDYFGVEGFTYRVSDGEFESEEAVVTIAVLPVNDAPLAFDNSATTDENQPVGIALLGSDVDGDDLDFVVTSAPVNGVLSGIGANRTYQPNAGFDGSDQLQFVATDGLLASQPATVTLTVVDVNEPPIALPQSVLVAEDGTVAITLTGSDADGDSLLFSVIGGTVNGTLSGSGPELTYTPAADFNGSDSLSFTVSDAAETSQPAWVAITVTPVNDVPTANSQSIVANEDQTLAVNLTGDDIDGDTLSFSVLAGPANGTLSGNGGNLSYTPGPDFNGADSFQFVASDGAAQSLAAMVSINVQAVNDAPVTDAQAVTVAEDGMLTITLTGSDVDQDVIEFSVSSGPLNGTLSGTAPELSYVPNADFNGADQFTVIANDGTIDSATAVIQIAVTAVNDAPFGDDLALSGDEDKAIAAFLDGDDADGDDLTFTIVEQPTNGALSGSGSALTYTPSANFNGADLFTYTVSDGQIEAGPYDVTLSVNPLNDMPLVDAQAVSLDEDTSIAITVTGTDIDGDDLEFAVVGGPANGTLSGVAPDLIYAPNANFNGSDQIEVVANDGSVDSDPQVITISVNPVNDVPVADAATVAMDEDDSVSILLTGSDSDGDSITFALVTPPANGSISGTVPNLTYTPSANFNGSDTLAFNVSDGTETSMPATVDLTVNPVNDAPLANAQSLSMNQGQSLTITLSGSDVDNDPLSFVIGQASVNGSLTGIAPDLSYTPDPNFFGTDALTFLAHDGVLDSSAATVDIVVFQVNSPPVITSTAIVEGQVGTQYIYNVVADDADGDALIFALTSAPPGMTIAADSGIVSWTPAIDQQGTHMVSARVTDPDGAFDQQDFVVEVLLANEAPQIVSSAITSADEGQIYAYDIDAIDPNLGDVLTYELLAQPEGMTIQADSGQINWQPPSDYVQPVLDQNPWCLAPSDPGSELDALSLRVSNALERGGEYAATETLAWDTRNNCIGCHVQNQTLMGLQSSLDKALVDEQAAEYLLERIINAVGPDGSIGVQARPIVETTFAIWALSYVPDRDRTFEVRARALRFFWDNRIESGDMIYWQPEGYDDGWIRWDEPVNAVVALAASRWLDDALVRTDLTVENLALAIELQGGLPAMSRYFVATSEQNEDSNLLQAFRLIGLGELRSQITELSLLADITAAIDHLDELLRSRGEADGGWNLNASGTVGDPLTSAWVGTALDYLEPDVSDPIVRSNIEFLLTTQVLTDGSWITNSGLFSTRLATTAMVMAYLPIALDFLDGRADLVVTDIQWDQTDGGLSAVVLNRGGAPVDSDSLVSFLDADSNPLGTATVSDLEAGESQTVTITLVAPPPAPLSVTVIANRAEAECEVGNNTTSAALVQARVEDSSGESDQQSWSINVRDVVNEPPVVTSTAPENGVETYLYRYNVRAQDPDLGDGLRFDVIEGPDDMWVQPATGRLTWVPNEGERGIYSIRLQVTDLRGLSSQQAFEINIRDQVLFASEPVTFAVLNEPYQYHASVTKDPDSVVSFNIVEAPEGMTIDPATGLVTWVPDENSLGLEVPVTLAVDEQFGSSDNQSFLIQVDLPNVAPRITSEPLRTYTTSRATNYAYTPAVEDDNLFESFSWSRLIGPETIGVNSSTGGTFWSRNNVLNEVPYPTGTVEPDWMCVSDPQAYAWPGGIEVARWLADRAIGQVLLSPLTDTNGDGVVTVTDEMLAVFLSRDTSGQVLLTAFDIQAGEVVWDFGSANLEFGLTPAIGDLDGDGSVEIIAQNRDRNLVAVGGDGVALWTSTEPTIESFRQGTPVSLADLEGDGFAEILVGGAVFDHLGNREWFLANTNPSDPTGTSVTPPLAVDLDLDGVKEVVLGPMAFTAEGTLLWSLEDGGLVNFQFASWAVGQLDQDAFPELVVAIQSFQSGRQLVRVEHDGQVTWSQTLFETTHPVLADFDGDQELEIYHPQRFDALFEADGTPTWNGNFNFSGQDQWAAVALDLNGDGALELLRSARDGFVVMNGATGKNITTSGAITSHISRVPIAVTRAGQPGLVYGTNAGLAMHQGVGLPWALNDRVVAQRFDFAGTREDDLTAPTGTRDLNGPFSAYPAITPSVQPLADVFVLAPSVEMRPDGVEVVATIRNRGLATSQEGLVLEFYAGDPAVALMLGSATLPALAASHETSVSLSGIDPALITDRVVAQVQAGNECHLDNNLATTIAVEIQVSDRHGLSDTQFWGVQIYDGGLPVILTTPQQTETYAQAEWIYQPQTDRGIRGGNVYYQFATWQTQPEGMTLDPVSGAIRWTPRLDQVGSHSVYFYAYGLDHRGPGQGFTVTVLEPTTSPPTIVSAPVLLAAVDQLYSYDVDATDPDGDTLIYSLDSAPPGMVIDADSGVVQWTPDQQGDFPVTVRASDRLGGVDTQSYVIAVDQASTPVPPNINSTPSLTGKVGRDYIYQVVATDPNNDPLSYAVSGPTGMAIDASGRLIWSPDAAGTVPVSVTVSDGTFTVTQSWTLRVLDAGILLEVFVSATPDPALPGEQVLISVIPINAAGDLTVTATFDGAPLVLDADLQAVITAGDAGTYPIVATADDGFEVATGSFNLRVGDTSSTVAPIVELISPDHHEHVTAPIDIIGSVSDADLSRWYVGYIERGRPSNEFVQLAEGTTDVNDAVLGRFDPTMLMNGQYAIVLQAEDTAGNVSQDVRIVIVTGNLKVGNFSITFEDVTIPVSGIPITITRTYDTRQKHKQLDFGYGWSIDYQNVRIHESRTLGLGWQLTETRSGPFGAFVEWCVRPNGDPIVTVTLPDGEVEEFRAKASPECTQQVPQTEIHVVFEPMNGTDSSLDAGLGTVRLLNDSILVYLDEPTVPVDPDRYTLTTPEGFIYHLEQGLTVNTVEDPNGNTLTFTENGVLHSSGKGIDFIRDGFGRIERILLPDNTELNYEFNPSGDLTAFIDQLNLRTEFTYTLGAPHYIEDIIDPRGVRVARNEYDDDGRLVAHIDADGNRIEYTHDIEGRTEIIKNRRGHTMVYTYDDEGNVLAETNALNETTLHEYDADRNETARVNALGHRTEWTFDDRNNQLTEKDPLGRITSSTFDDRNQLLTQTDPAGIPVIDNAYNARTGNLVQTTDALGNATVFGYDGETGNLETITDAENQVIQFIYDLFGNRVRQIDPRNTLSVFTVDDMGRQTTQTTSRTDETGQVRNFTTTFEYDDKGRLTRTIDPQNGISETVYNEIDKEIAMIDPRGNRTEFEYDARGNRVLTRFPDLTTEITGYDEEGNVITQTDRESRTTRMVYDAAGRLVETIYPDDTPGDDTDNPRTLNQYDPAGRLVALIDELSHKTEYGYDDAGRRTLVRDHLGFETHFEYDQRGSRTATVDAKGQRTEFVYDDAGRLLETWFQDGSHTETVYDNLGRKISETDQAGLATQFDYDPGGNLVAVIDALNQRTEYDYDEQSNKTVQRDAEGRETRWTYDDLGRVTSRILPLGQTESFVYDAAGNRTSMTDFNGVTSTYVYDDQNRQIRADYADGTFVVMTYTDSGQVDTVTDERGITGYTYDIRDRLTRIDYPNGQHIEYDYDAAGNRFRLETRNQVVVYTFDELNRLGTVTDATGTTSYRYDEVGNRAGIDYANGTRAEYTYDDLNRLVELTNFDSADQVMTRHTYTLGPAGNRESVDDEVHVTSVGAVSIANRIYTYDDLYRLVEEQVTDAINGNRTTVWTYDHVGNRTTQDAAGVVTAYTYDDNDRLLDETTGIDITTYLYDDNGNTLQKSLGATPVATYGYDARNRLAQADTGSQIAYTYDATGIRQSQTLGGTTVSFLVDPNRDYAQVIEEQGLTGTADVVYTYGDDLLNQQRLEGDSHYHYDGLGSTRTLSDVGGLATDGYSYQAFGEVEVQAGADSANAYLFTGEQFDPNVGFYYLRARYLDPSNGRFLGMDSFVGRSQDPATLHKYIYAHADPFNNIDPSGNITLVGILQGANHVGNVYTVASIGFQLATGNYAGASKEIIEEIVYSKFGGAFGKRIVNLSQRQIGVFYRLWQKTLTKKLKIGNSASSRDLTHNLEAVGVPKPSGTQAHHIVGGATAEGKRLREKLKALGIDVNSPMNGVFLPGCGKSKAIGMIHCGKHTGDYETAVSRLVDSVGNDKAAVINVLNDIRNELLNGTFTKLNRRVG